MGRRHYSLDERRMIAAGDFFTEAELRAKPWLRRTADKFAAEFAKSAGITPDPNNRPMSAKRRTEIEAMVQVCAHCGEPGDERSALDGNSYHPECAEAWAAEVAARKTRP